MVPGLWTRSRLCRGAALLLAAMALSFVQAQLEGTTITVALRSLPETDVIVARLPEFQRDTGITVNIVTYPELLLRERTIADLSTGAGLFDVIAVDSVWVPELVEAGWLLPLTEFVTEEDDIGDFAQSSLDLFSWQGTLYGAPVYAEITHLMYRKDLFEDAGFDPPETLEELREIAAHFHDPPRMHGIAMRGLRGDGMNIYTWSQWLRSYGGEFLDEESRPAFNDEAGVQATQEYASLLQDFGPLGVSSYGWDEVQTAFVTGRAAMIIDANNFYTRIEDPNRSEIAGQIGYANVPAGPAGLFPGNYALGFAISAVGVDDEAEQQAATRFIMWATSPEIQLASIDAGIVSQTRTSVLESDAFSERIDGDWIQSTLESWELTHANYRPRFPGWRVMGSALGIAVEEVIAGIKPAEQALEEAAASTETAFRDAGILGQPRPYDLP